MVLISGFSKPFFWNIAHAHPPSLLESLFDLEEEEEERTQAVNRSSLRLEWLTEGRKGERGERGDLIEIKLNPSSVASEAGSLSRSIWAKWPRPSLWFGNQKE